MYVLYYIFSFRIYVKYLNLGHDKNIVFCWLFLIENKFVEIYLKTSQLYCIFFAWYAKYLIIF